MLRLLLAGMIAAILGACAMPVMQQSPLHVHPQAAAAAGTIPNPVPITASLPKPRPVQKPETYSVVVDDVKVHDLLFALARDAHLNVDISPGISGVVTLNAVDQTLPQLLSRIARQVDMRWELDGPNLEVLPDTPYLRIYHVDYLDMTRVSSSMIGVSSQITSGSGSGGGRGANAGGANSSSTTLRDTSDNKFWDTLVRNIQGILNETNAGSAAAPAAAKGAPAPLGGEATSVIANPEAGILTVRATSRQQAKIQEFLDQVMANARRQVLIEATVVEVQLNNQYQQGIDWSLLRSGRLGFNLTQSGAASPAAVNTNFFTGTITDETSRWNLSSTLRLLESFGNVRVLSSPKLSVLNNQTALLKVVNEVVYFNVQVNQSATGVSGTVLTTYNTTPHTAPVGFIMNVTPEIAADDTVMLNLRPSLTRIVSFVPDPNPSLGSVQNLIPELQRREMESVIKVNSGQIAVMGGLIEDSLNNVEDGIPGVNRTAAGSLLAQHNVNNSKTELVVFIRPLVIRDPSIEGDYRAFRSLVPGEDFMAQPNPARVRAGAP